MMSWFGRKTPPSKSTLTIVFDEKNVNVRIDPAAAQSDDEREQVASAIAQMVVLLSSGRMSPYLQQAISVCGMPRDYALQSLAVVEACLHPERAPKNRDADAVNPLHVFAHAFKQTGVQ